jgi:hypothetical protein
MRERVPGPRRKPSSSGGHEFGKVAAGTCKLVVDAGKFEGFTLALETDRSPAYGVLSGPIELLKAAHRAGWVKIELSEGTLIDIGIVQVSNTGMAFIILSVDTLPEI